METLRAMATLAPAVSAPIARATASGMDGLRELYRAKHPAGKGFKFRADGKDAGFANERDAIIATLKAMGATAAQIESADTPAQSFIGEGVEVPNVESVSDDGGEIL